MSSPQTSSSSSPQDPDPPPQSSQSDSQEISLEDYGDVSASSQSQPSSKESQTRPEILKNSHHPPRKVIVYTRRHILNLSSSPLVQRPEGMPALKDWFGDWSEQHPNSQTKKDTSDTNNTSGNRRFPRRDQDEGGDTVLSPLLPSSFSPFVDNTRTTFRSTLSQPSQMGNFRHQSIRGDLTRNGGDRDKENDRDKEGHERLRSLSDMYDRERFGLPSSTTALIRTQPRESSGHHPSSSISGSTTAGRLTGRERIDRDRDKDSTRRNENRDPVRRKGGESIDWRRGAETSRFAKDDQSRGESERDRSPEVDRSRRERSTSRERWSERRGRDGDEKDKENDKSRPREEDRKPRTKESESHSTSTTSNRWSERPIDEKRKSRDENDKDTKEERKDRDRERRDRLREHPDAKRDRELREGWTIGEERSHAARRAPGRGGERRTSGADEDKEVRKDREKDKEPAWMDDYVPEPNAPKAGIFGGKIEGMEDELQAWKRKQASTKQQTTTAPSTSTPTLPSASNGIMPSSSSESLPKDGTIFTTGSITPNPLSLTTDEQAKASDAFFFGLMKGEGKAKSHNTTPAKSPEPEPSADGLDLAINKSPAPIIPLSSTVDPTRVDPAVISAAPQGSSKTNNPSSINPPPGASSLPPSHDTLQPIHRSSPSTSQPVLTSFTPGPIGSQCLQQ
ncbi:hypothetical protein Clacol_008039 [Clathrus columnatus]|uniref:Uncharacterized protein n=1 Tax=Clathrus columnatus TaxID=1419009 RepID=A0AAV5AJB5_9AGAM|nr:hypothetical protein Clacol_008039 [Clathrus columnatus]